MTHAEMLASPHLPEFVAAVRAGARPNGDGINGIKSAVDSQAIVRLCGTVFDRDHRKLCEPGSKTARIVIRAALAAFAAGMAARDTS